MASDDPSTRDLIAALKDTCCVFREKSIVWHVRVSQATADDWGVSLVLRVIPTPGFTPTDCAEFDISGRWDVVGVTPFSLHAAYVSWTLIIDPELVEKIRRKGLECRDSPELSRFAQAIH